MLCGCGRGELPPGFIDLPPGCEAAARFATHVAVSPVFFSRSSADDFVRAPSL